MSFDPYLYVALAAGFVAGRLISWRSPWVERAILITIIILVFALGASLGSLSGPEALLTVGYSVAFAVLILGVTIGVLYLLPRRPVPPTSTTALPRPFVPLGPVLVGDIIIGYLVGHFVAVPGPAVLTGTLYALLALVAFNLKFSRAALRYVGTPLLAAVGGAVLAAVVAGLATPLGLQAAFGTTLGFGWYTLSGPLVTARFGAALGLLAFLTNFLRENLTMVLAPTLGPRIKGEGLAALGGAASMDTVLYFVTRYGDPESGSLALASGLILTIAASLILPLVLSFG